MAISEGEKKFANYFHIWSIFQKYPAKYKIQELHISNRAKKRRKFLNSTQQKLHFITYYLLISILTVSVLNSLKSLVLTRFKNLFTYLKRKRKLQNGLTIYTQHINRYIIHDNDHVFRIRIHS